MTSTNILAPLRQHVLIKAAIAHGTPEGLSPKNEYGVMRKRVVRKSKDKDTVSSQSSKEDKENHLATPPKRSSSLRGPLIASATTIGALEDVFGHSKTPASRPWSNGSPGFRTVLRKNTARDIFGKNRKYHFLY